MNFEGSIICIESVETGIINEYIYSSHNWLKKPAAMKGGLVYQWLPKGIVNNAKLITSGKKYWIKKT
jgi:hypothetical protein